MSKVNKLSKEEIIKKSEEALKASGLDAFEKYSDEMLEKEKKAVTKTFKQIFSEAKEPRTAYVPELNCNINYRGITMQDAIELNEIENLDKRGEELVFRMWKNGDPTIERADFNKLEIALKDAILTAMLRKTPFLLPRLAEDLSQELESGGKLS